MGRKRKSGLDTCPFDVNMLSDIRMRRLIRSHQGDAIAVYTAALFLIYRDGYYVEYNDDARFKLSEQTGVSEATVDAVIADAVACGLFDSEVFASARVLTSNEIQDTYVAECAKTKRKVEIKPIVISSEEMPIYSEEIAINSEEIAINSEEMPINSEFTQKNSEEIEVYSEEIIPAEILPVPVAHTQKVITTTIDVLDSSDNTLELFNNSNNSSNNLNNQERKENKKEKKEVCELALPYCSAEFVSTWEILKKQPKWKKKTKSALQMSLNKLGKYPEEFAILLMENAIAGDWQGVVFTWTPDEFRKWQSRKSGVPLQSGNKKPKDIYESNMESMNEAFRLIDEKYGT